MNKSMAVFVSCLVLLVAGCPHGDVAGTYNVTIELTDLVTGEPIVGADVEFATARVRDAAGLIWEEDDLSSAGYRDHQTVRTDAQGRFSADVFTIWGVSLLFPFDDRCGSYGLVNDIWIIRVSDTDVSETVVIQMDAVASASNFEGVAVSGETVRAEVIETGCADRRRG